MKLLQITEAYGAGVRNAVNQLAFGMARRGHDVTLAVAPRAETSPGWESLIPREISVRAIPLTRELSLRRDWEGFRYLRKLLREVCPDVIHAHSSKAGFLVRAVAKAEGLSHRVVYSPHAFAHLGTQSRLRSAVYYGLERTASALFGGTVAACSKDEAIEAKRLATNCVVINNAVNVQAIDVLKQSTLRLSDKRLRVFSVGRICAAKRPDLFTQVAAELARRGIDCSFTWIGSGDPFPPSVHARSIGWLDWADVVRRLATECDVYLQTSAFEGLSLAVLEAQALGLPAVVTDVPGNRSAVVHKITGFVSPSNVNSLADSLQHLAVRPKLREEMGLAARARIEDNFTEKRLLDDFEDLYKKISAL